MEFLKTLFGGGKRRRTRKSKKRGGAACETGEACAAQFSTDSSLSQGEAFLKMNQPYHGGKRRTRHRKMRGGAADLAVAFDTAPADIHQMSGTAVLDSAFAELSKFAPTPQAGGRRRQRGGHADLETAFQAPSVELNEAAGTSVLDAAMSQLGKLNPFKGGARRSRRGSRRHGGAILGNSPIDAPSMLLRPEDYSAAFLNPQWVQENVVNPNFHGPDNALVATGGKHKKSRKGRKGRKGSRKGRKASRKATTRKCPRGKTYRKTFIRNGRRIMGKCVRK